MARKKKAASSPTLELTITEDDRDRAIKSNSGGCLIADAIKRQYPHLSSVTVDMATIRATDRERGLRFTWLTPSPAQHLLLAFDQGWPNPTERLTLRRAIKVSPITASPKARAARAERRAARIAELEAKQERGEELTKAEKISLARSRDGATGPERPTSEGPTTLDDDGTVHGGNPLPQGKAHPNLLRGRNRHFGAKLADPGEAFRTAVEAEVERRNAAEAQGELEVAPGLEVDR